MSPERTTVAHAPSEPLTHPSISIGMPVFNGERYLAEAIDSLLAQSFTDFELIISDNASEDSTRDICQAFARRDARIRYFRQPINQGAPKNFRFVLDQARAPYFKWAAANDRCHPDLLRVCKAVLDERPDVVLALGRAVVIDHRGEVVRRYHGNLSVDATRPSGRFVQVVDQFGLNNTHAGLFRSELLRKTKPEQAFLGGDLVVLAELALYGKFHQVSEVLFCRREAPGAVSRFRTAAEITELLSPGAYARRHWPMWRISFGQLGVALRAASGLADKTAMCLHLLKRYYWNRQLYWQELRANLWPSKASRDSAVTPQAAAVVRPSFATTAEQVPRLDSSCLPPCPSRPGPPRS